MDGFVPARVTLTNWMMLMVCADFHRCIESAARYSCGPTRLLHLVRCGNKGNTESSDEVCSDLESEGTLVIVVEWDRLVLSVPAGMAKASAADGHLSERSTSSDERHFMVVGRWLQVNVEGRTRKTKISPAFRITPGQQAWTSTCTWLCSTVT